MHRSTRSAEGIRNNVAVDGIDLRVEVGRILGLIGPNGAGRHSAQCGFRPHSISGVTEGVARPWTEREKLMRDAVHCRCRRAAARMRVGRLSYFAACIRDSMRRRRKVFSPRPPSARQQGPGLSKAWWRNCTSPGHGMTRNAGAGEPTLGLVSVSQAVLRFAAKTT